ncbi:uncharacterized protein UTRI_06333 [Ustilago trichophora]|uniref:CCHC-type domain-containing protein n=1 Tax=Ustilago trichophora TaxID=86804 RepID=A0A5C3EII9_9BASI|nr:uncharacterized protein UTRI_06333 [Ustilago trichophora]
MAPKQNYTGGHKTRHSTSTLPPSFIDMFICNVPNNFPSNAWNVLFNPAFNNSNQPRPMYPDTEGTWGSGWYLPRANEYVRSNALALRDVYPELRIYTFHSSRYREIIGGSLFTKDIMTKLKDSDELQPLQSPESPNRPTSDDLGQKSNPKNKEAPVETSETEFAITDSDIEAMELLIEQSTPPSPPTIKQEPPEQNQPLLFRNPAAPYKNKTTQHQMPNEIQDENQKASYGTTSSPTITTHPRRVLILPTTTLDPTPPPSNKETMDDTNNGTAANKERTKRAATNKTNNNTTLNDIPSTKDKGKSKQVERQKQHTAEEWINIDDSEDDRAHGDTDNSRKVNRPEKTTQDRLLMIGMQPFHLKYTKGGVDMDMNRIDYDTKSFNPVTIEKTIRFDPTFPPSEVPSMDKLLHSTLLLAQEYAEGTWEFYPWILQTTPGPYFPQDAQDWIANNQNQRNGQLNYKGAQHYADLFANHFGIQRIHAYTFIGRISNASRKDRSAHTSDRYAMKDHHSLKNKLSKLALKIFDLILFNNKPKEIRQETWEAVKTFRATEWFNLIGICAFEQFNVFVGAVALKRAWRDVTEQLYPLKGPQQTIKDNKQRLENINTLTQTKFSDHVRAFRAAAGARISGKGFDTDLKDTDCLARTTPTQAQYNADDLRHKSWIRFQFDKPPQSTKRKQTPTKSKDSGPRFTETDKVIPPLPHAHLDRTLILRGKLKPECAKDTCPMPDTPAIHTVWRQGIIYCYNEFQGVTVTEAMYRKINTGESEIALTFASRQHFATACFLLPLWTPFLTFADTPLYIPTTKTEGRLHPLSQIKMEVNNKTTTHTLAIQRAPLHPANTVMPDAVSIVSRENNKTIAKITYPSPAAAAMMLNKKVVVIASSRWPFIERKANIVESEPLTPFIPTDDIETCTKCGNLGHFSAKCISTPYNSSNCSRCECTGHKHARTEPCPLENMFNKNAAITLEKASRTALTSGIFAEKNKDYLHMMFGDTSNIPKTLCEPRGKGHSKHGLGR